jgi:hypothetical protein
MIDDIALYQGKPTVHGHMVVGLPAWDAEGPAWSGRTRMRNPEGDGHGRPDSHA